jgi:Flp pilus assembly protein TadG
MSIRGQIRRVPVLIQPRRDERGTALVEFALLLPVFVMLLLGLLTGANAYNLKGQLVHASREAARYGATDPTGAVSGANLNSWLDGVYSATDITRKREQTGSAAPVYTDGSPCFTDSYPASSRVQVVVSRDASLQTGLYTIPLTLRSKGVSRFEALQ